MGGVGKDKNYYPVLSVLPFFTLQASRNALLLRLLIFFIAVSDSYSSKAPEKFITKNKIYSFILMKYETEEDVSFWYNGKQAGIEDRY